MSKTVKKMAAYISQEGWRAAGQLLKESREAMGWSMQDLADRVKGQYDFDVSIGSSTISSIERGNVEPRVSTLLAILELGFVKHPATGKPMTMGDFCAYAAEQSFHAKRVRPEQARLNSLILSVAETSGSYGFAASV